MDNVNVTLLLANARAGEPGAEDRLWRAVYGELRRMAGEKMAGEGRAVTLQATALAHEAWLRLGGPEAAARDWSGRAHFFAAAAEAMRRILVDQARRRLSLKRGGGTEHLRVAEAGREIPAPEADERILRVHEALEELEREDARMAGIVKLRFFGGFTQEEIAAMLEVNEKTVRRQWLLAKGKLFHLIRYSPSFPDAGEERDQKRIDPEISAPSVSGNPSHLTPVSFEKKKP